MAFLLYENISQWIEFWIMIFAPLLSMLVTAFRFSATSQTKRRHGLEDWLALGGLISLVLFALAALLGQ